MASVVGGYRHCKRYTFAVYSGIRDFTEGKAIAKGHCKIIDGTHLVRYLD
jgi:hypothetical protein